MLNLVEVISTYVRETRRLERLPSSTETTFYPDLKLLLNAVLKSERLPFDVITGTSEGGARRRDVPDFVLGDSSLFVGVYGEVKRADTTLAKLAISTEQNDQIGRYLSQTGVVLLCNVRGLGLLTCDPSFTREAGKPVEADAGQEVGQGIGERKHKVSVHDGSFRVADNPPEGAGNRRKSAH